MNKKEIGNYEAPTIRVVVIGTQGGFKTIECKVDQNYALLKDGTKILFKTSQVRRVWAKGLIFWDWYPSIAWRAGTEEALEPDVTDKFLPAMSQKGTKKFIDKLIYDAIGAEPNLLDGWRFWALLGCLIAIIVMVALSLFGVQLSANTPTTQIIQNATFATPFPTPHIVG